MIFAVGVKVGAGVATMDGGNGEIDPRKREKTREREKDRPSTKLGRSYR